MPVAAVLLAALLVAGCGGDEPVAQPGTTAPTSTGSPTSDASSVDPAPTDDPTPSDDPGAPSPSAELLTWVEAYCVAAGPVLEAEGRLPALEGEGDELAELVAQFVQVARDVAPRYAEGADAIEELGPAPLPDGADATVKLATAFRAASDVYAAMAADLEGVDQSDPAAVDEVLASDYAELQARFETMGSILASPEFVGAVLEAEGCNVLG